MHSQKASGSCDGDWPFSTCACYASPTPLISTRTCELLKDLQKQAVFAQTVPSVMLEAAPSLAISILKQSSCAIKVGEPWLQLLEARLLQQKMRKVFDQRFSSGLPAAGMPHGRQARRVAMPTPEKNSGQSSAQPERCFLQKAGSAEH